MSVSTFTRFHVVVVIADPEAPWLDACLAAVQAQTLAPYRVTLFDRSGTRAGAALTARYPEINVMRSTGPISHAEAHNRAAATSRDADALLLLEPESVLSITALEHLADAFERNGSVGVFGTKVLNEDVATIQELGATMAPNGLPRPIQQGNIDEGQFAGVRHALCAPIAAFAVRTGVWCELGGLDEFLGSMHYEKTDFCYRAQQQNWRVGVTCDSTVTYFGGQIGKDSTRDTLDDYFRGRFNFLAKHYDRRDWWRRFMPAELRWLLSGASRGQRGFALRSLWQGMRRADERRSRAPLPPTTEFKL